jgi:hypothetical protein
VNLRRIEEFGLYVSYTIHLSTSNRKLLHSSPYYTFTLS